MRQIFKKLSGLGDKANIQLKDGLDPEEEYQEEEYEDFEDEEENKGQNIAIEEEDEEEDEEKKWLEENYEEGQLSIDVYQTPNDIIVKSTIAGVKPEDIDISINNDMLTIRGRREMIETVRDQDYLYRECYWGSFSRSIILPVEIESDKVDASLENGVLTVTLPKAKSAKPISIKVKEK